MKNKTFLIILLVFTITACTPANATPTADSQLTPANTSPSETGTPTSPPVEPTAASLETTEIPVTAQQTITLQIVPGESTVTYEVGETFLNQNNRFAVAVGVTDVISGEVYANPENPPASELGTITVDISQFRSDSSRRDGAIRSRFLESSQYPLVTFQPQAIQGLPQSYTPGQPYDFSVSGELTIRDITRPVDFTVTAMYADQTLTGTAQTTILMSDYGFGPISIAGILNTEDEVKVTLDFVARP